MRQLNKEVCCFLDSSIIFSLLFDEFKNRIDILKSILKKYKLKCYLTDSVNAEIKDAFHNIMDFLETNLKLLKNLIIEKKGISLRIPENAINEVLEQKDAMLFEKSFISIYNTIKDEDIRERRIKMLREMEEQVMYLFDGIFLEQDKININDFFVKYLKMLFETISQLENKLSEILSKFIENIINVIPSSSLIDDLHEIGIHTSDARHIASVAKYQANLDCKVIFVSFDYKHIVNKQDAIYRISKVQCTDPLYLKYYIEEFVSSY